MAGSVSHKEKKYVSQVFVCECVCVCGLCASECVCECFLCHKTKIEVITLETSTVRMDGKAVFQGKREAIAFIVNVRVVA